MKRALALAASLTTCLAQSAQSEGERAQLELAKAQRQLQQNRSEVDRLIDMRLRHDLGLPEEEDDSQFRPATPVTTASIERSRQELRDEDLATASLLERYNKLRAAVEQLHAETAERRKVEAQQRTFVVPQAGVALPQSQLPASTKAIGAVAPAPAGQQPPAAEPVPAAVPVPSSVDLLGLGPVRGQIHGSNDHQRVAQALFKAGQTLMDRAALAREQGRAEMARDLDERGVERLQRSLEELAPLLAMPEPAYQALFYQGRCRELLFRHAELYEGLSLAKSTRDYQRREQEVREPFLVISARDVTQQGERGEVQLLGPWGMAAQAAMEHFRWMNLHASYDPRAAIEATTWPGEREL